MWSSEPERGRGKEETSAFSRGEKLCPSRKAGKSKAKPDFSVMNYLNHRVCRASKQKSLGMHLNNLRWKILMR